MLTCSDISILIKDNRIDQLLRDFDGCNNELIMRYADKVMVELRDGFVVLKDKFRDKDIPYVIRHCNVSVLASCDRQLDLE